ncbi:DEAD/DEAH box helicase [Bdellovibrio sp. SKB1291214]|uniref:DEAD/DEAH box helicase n=1 Tax=Bdellovibrio sp. SKB1291214 TaxID=1732569 RepID=UPI00223FB8DC|nr:DEAD/DEAH box helicase [Bdellovibrio sp. SKB1291214]UYL09276.1 DEAD/DEAH box helicase [Bdellovibrio sp. SKB1291214]
MTPPLTTVDTFESFGLSAPLMEAMKDMGFSTPTPIQKQAIPLLLGGANDFIGLASTGTGKTAAFGIPLIENLDATIKDTQALVLSPTRELALQVAEQLALLGKKKGIRVVTIYGGASYRTQIDGIKRGAHIVVATPGRLVDFLEQKMIKLSKVQTVILDEADEMLSMGFKDALDFILSATHPDDAASNERAACRTWLFSATMSTEVRRITEKYLENPETVAVNKVGSTADTIEQIYYTVKNMHKTEVISRLLQTAPEFYGIIFCQTKMEVAELADILTQRGFPADSLHGDKSQQEREATLKKFKARAVKVIVATDVAARGLDIKDLTHVINHSLPWDAESYVHRIGRTGRNGSKGVAITLVNSDQLTLLRRVMNTTKATFTKGVVPSADEVAGLKIKNVLDKVGSMDATNPSLLLAADLIQDLVQADDINFKDLSTEDLLARFIVAYFPDVFVKKDVILDYMGDRIPRELLPRDPNNNRFTAGRDGGGDRGGYRDRPRTGGGYRGDRGGFRSNRRDDGDRPRYNDGGYQNDAPSRGASAPRRSGGASASFRGNNDAGGGERAERSTSARTERYDREEGRGNRAPAGDNGGGERSFRKRSFNSDENRGARAERTERADHPGIKRSRPSGGSSAPRRFRD